MHIGPAGEKALDEHLRRLDQVVEKIDEKTLGVCEVCHDSCIQPAGAHLPASQMISSLRDALQRFTGNKSPVDDTTIIAMDIVR
jgi:hypothetical protein